MAQYIQKAPAVITRYLREKDSLIEETEGVVKRLITRSKVNKHVLMGNPMDRLTPENKRNNW